MPVFLLRCALCGEFRSLSEHRELGLPWRVCVPCLREIVRAIQALQVRRPPRPQRPVCPRCSGRIMGGGEDLSCLQCGYVPGGGVPAPTPSTNDSKRRRQPSYGGQML